METDSRVREDADALRRVIAHGRSRDIAPLAPCLGDPYSVLLADDWREAEAALARLVAAAETTPDECECGHPRIMHSPFQGCCAAGCQCDERFTPTPIPCASPVVEDASTGAPVDSLLDDDDFAVIRDEARSSSGEDAALSRRKAEFDSPSGHAVGASERLAAIRARVDGLGNRLATWEFAGTPWKTREANELLAEVSWLLNSLLDRGVLSPSDGAAPVFQPEPAPANDLWQKIQDQRAANDKLQRKYNTIKGQLGAMEAACERAVMRENARFVAAEAAADRLREAARAVLDYENAPSRAALSELRAVLAEEGEGQ